MGHHVAPIHHSQSSLTRLRSGERISRLGGGRKSRSEGKRKRECGRIGGKVIERHVPSTHTHTYTHTAVVVFILDAEYISSWLCRLV